MLAEIRPALTLLVALTWLTGVAYPLAVTGIAQAGMPDKAGGSLAVLNGKIVGSQLIGQCWSDPKWFWGRPSATTPACNAAASSGSNLGPSNPVLRDIVRKRIEVLQQADPSATGLVPADLVTASASGLDPDISPEAAYFQVHRVAVARGLSDQVLRQLVAAQVEGRWLGLLGEPHVNVLALNLALQARH